MSARFSPIISTGAWMLGVRDPQDLDAFDAKLCIDDCQWIGTG